MLKFLVLSSAMIIFVNGTSTFFPLFDSVRRNLTWNRSLEGKIVGGHPVSPNSIPFQVSLKNNDEEHLCGGAILSEDFVLTAAHCFGGMVADEVNVWAGEHSLHFDDGTEQVRSVEEIIIHPDYEEHYYDLCLLRMASPLTLNQIVSAAKLPHPGQTFEGTALVSGWGILASGSSAEVLQAVEVPIVNIEDCSIAYGGELDEYSMICAGEEGKDSCQGDSGGPLICDGDVLCGIVSFGLECGEVDYPGVYTKTSYFIDYIQEQMGEMKPI